MTTNTTSRTAERDLMDVLGLAVIKLVSGLLTAAFLALSWAVLFPMVSLPIVAAVAAGVFVHPWAGVGVAGGAVAGMVLWRRRSRETFERWLTARARARALAWVRYRRRWIPLMTACNLVVREGERVMVPRWLEVWIGEADDLVLVRMLPGQCPEDFENRADHLAHAFGADECRVRVDGPGVIELNFRYGDTLSAPVDLPHIDGGLGSTKEAA
ncbi:hypothetical protein [Nocardia farcinica]